jgi:asparagine synthase (glutamine-hydrolysing)
MCGIAGSIGFFDDSLLEAVRAMNRAQAHRGPDDEGIWSFRGSEGSSGAALGHRRLSILDLSPLGHQPMIDPESGAVICFNGEVYNFAELRRELEALGMRFTSGTDTEVILKAYVAWGPSAIDRLRGMFAFAIWDPERKEMLLARDRLGIKPLYLATVENDRGKTSLFASELRALLATGLIDRRIDHTGLASYFWNGIVTGPNTLVRGISLLPTGTSLVVGLDGRMREPQRYWRLPGAAASNDVARAKSDLGARLAEAVKIRLVSDVPLGIFLSGGIDSSAVAALAMQTAERPVTTFNIRFEEARYDESSHARAVATALGTDHHEVTLSEASFGERLPAALMSLDQPTFDAINTYFVSRAVREAGLTVALAGTGGDETFGGYSSFADLGRARRSARAAAALPKSLRHAGARAVSRLLAGTSGLVPPQTRWGKLTDVLESGGDLLSLYQISYGLFTRSFLAELSDVKGESTDYGLPRERAEELRSWIADQPELHAISMLELSSFIGERLLRDTDAASMAVSLEVRVPLLDHRVIEALARVPAEERFFPLRKKRLLRELALGRLNPELFDRPKAGFELPLAVWCRQQLKPELTRTFKDRDLCQKVGLNADAVLRLWTAFQDGAPGLYWSRIWSLYTLLWWCREHSVYL